MYKDLIRHSQAKWFVILMKNIQLNNNPSTHILINLFDIMLLGISNIKSFVALTKYNLLKQLFEGHTHVNRNPCTRECWHIGSPLALEHAVWMGINRQKMTVYLEGLFVHLRSAFMCMRTGEKPKEAGDENLWADSAHGSRKSCVWSCKSLSSPERKYPAWNT